MSVSPTKRPPRAARPMPYAKTVAGSARRAYRPEVHPGMGAIPHAAGVAFRVWAPHAEAVSVVGTFNDWKPDAHPMTRENDEGYWYADVPGAKIGAEYRYHITAPTGEFTRIDPYAREVTNSVGNAVVHDPNFDWGDDHFPTPNWNELVIYELHVGTFNDPNPADDKPAKPFKALFLTQSAGFKHGSVNRPEGKLSPAEIAMTQFGQQTGLIDVHCTQDATADFRKDNLKNYDVVMLYTTLDLPIFVADAEYFFQEWLPQQGHACIGFHSATDTFHNYEKYTDMIGGTFNGHPWNSGETETFSVHDANHPAMKPFGAEFEFKDGKIWRQRDRFDFYRWSRQAFGMTGVLLGWTGFLRGKVQAEAAKGLAIFMAKQAS